MTGCQLVLCSVLLSSGYLVNAPEAGLRWNDHYGRALQAAQATKRPMVVVLEKPKVAAANDNLEQLQEADLEKLREQKYEICRVDVTTDYGQRVAEAFGAEQFPYTAVTDKTSKSIVYRKAGPMSELDWSNALARNNVTPDTAAPVRETRKVIVDAEPAAAPMIIMPQPVFTPARVTCFT